MRTFVTEHRNLIIAGSISTLLIAGSSFYLYQAYDHNVAALAELETVSGSLSKIQNSTPSPNAENLEELHRQKEDAKKAVEKLTAEVRALDIPLPEMTPPQFQKTLNETVQSLGKLAKTNQVEIPQNFYLDFARYSKSVPKPEVTPLLGRQLQVASLISELLFQTGPKELKVFERTEFDLERDPAALAKETAPAKDKEKEKQKDKEKAKPKVDPPKPLLTGQSFKLQFVTLPANLREFLNSLANQKTCLLVTRSIKVENEKQVGPSKKGPEGDVPGGAAPGGVPNLNALGGSAVETAPGAPGAPGANVSQFIVGTETIEVTLRVELVSFLDEPAKRP